jgi:transposase
MGKSRPEAAIATIGIDLGKSVFQLHGVDAAGEVVLQRAVKRRGLLAFLAKLPACLVGMEACATAHYWARCLTELGHEVRLIPPSYVKAYVRRQKNDAADAAAICEAVTRPSMRFVSVKSEAQQAALMLHRARELLVRQRTALINALRGHLAEFGIVAAQGARHVAGLVAVVQDHHDARLPASVRAALAPLVCQMTSLENGIDDFDRQILAWHCANETSRRLATIPSIGPLIASAITASVTDPTMFRSGRDFAAFLGLVPRQSSSGGKERLGRISKMGDRYLRKLLVVGATAVLRYAKTGSSASKIWAQGLLAKKPFKVVAVALANKTARIVWALLRRGGIYRADVMANPAMRAG